MAIGIDQSTALLIDTVTNTLTTAGGATVTLTTAGDATVIGNSPTNHLYFLTTTGTRPNLQRGQPLTWPTPAVDVYRATVGDNFQFDQASQTWKPLPGSSLLDAPYTLWVTNGTVNSSQLNGSIY
jgi:hypothetical protein